MSGVNKMSEAKEMNELLSSLGACREAMIWSKNKSWKEVYETCPRGDWLLWLFARTNPDDSELLISVKNRCANTVRHLITKEISRNAATAYAAYAAAYAAYAAAIAKKSNQMETADICRKYLPFEIWNIKKESGIK